MNHSCTLALRNDLAELNRLHDFMDTLSKNWSLPSDVQHDITLAVEELVTNTIRYGYDIPGPHQINCSFTLGDAMVTVTISDDGHPFDPFSYPTADISAPLSERKIGGLGIHLVRSLMDATDYERLDNENRIILRKKLR